MSEDFSAWFERNLMDGSLGLYGLSAPDLKWMRPILESAWRAGRQSGIKSPDEARVWNKCSEIANKHMVMAELSGVEQAQYAAIAARGIYNDILIASEKSAHGD